MLIRVRALPERILALFLGTPGIDVFRPAGANAAVAVGYEHPIDLASCSVGVPGRTRSTCSGRAIASTCCPGRSRCQRHRAI